MTHAHKVSRISKLCVKDARVGALISHVILGNTMPLVQDRPCQRRVGGCDGLWFARPTRRDCQVLRKSNGGLWHRLWPARRASRWFFKKLGSQAFNKVLEYFTDTKQDNSVARILVIRAWDYWKPSNRYREQSRDFFITAKMVGFANYIIEIRHAPRHTEALPTHLENWFA